jgi:hypothetical protein
MLTRIPVIRVDRAHQGTLAKISLIEGSLTELAIAHRISADFRLHAHSIIRRSGACGTRNLATHRERNLFPGRDTDSVSQPYPYERPVWKVSPTNLGIRYFLASRRQLLR